MPRIFINKVRKIIASAHGLINSTNALEPGSNKIYGIFHIACTEVQVQRTRGGECSQVSIVTKLVQTWYEVRVRVQNMSSMHRLVCW